MNNKGEGAHIVRGRGISLPYIKLVTNDNNTPPSSSPVLEEGGSLNIRIITNDKNTSLLQPRAGGGREFKYKNYN
jgi:hypothetical protein